MIRRSQRSSGASRGVRRWVAIGLLSVALLGAVEVAVRGFSRLARGEWPRTRASALYDQLTVAVGLYRPHPFLNTVASSGSGVEVFGKSARFNTLGYRSPERPLAKPPGAIRVLTVGGSTTFDLLADEDRKSWPWMLEARLRETRPEVEVWNAGLPGWTSLENTISLVLRDLDLEPDVVILYEGINDLQPGSHVPFDSQYVDGHAAFARLSAGIGLPALPWYQRLVILEWFRELVLGRSDPWEMILSGGDRTRPSAELSASALEVFGRNLRSQIVLAQDRGARVLVVSQRVVMRRGHHDSDARYIASWIPGLDPTAIDDQLQRLNRVARDLASELGVETLDASRLGGWGDEHFDDPMHFSAAGSHRFVEVIAPTVADLVAEVSDSE